MENYTPDNKPIEPEEDFSTLKKNARNFYTKKIKPVIKTGILTGLVAGVSTGIMNLKNKVEESNNKTNQSETSGPFDEPSSGGYRDGPYGPIDEPSSGGYRDGPYGPITKGGSKVFDEPSSGGYGKDNKKEETADPYDEISSGGH